MVKGFEKLSESVDEVIEFSRVLGVGVRVLAKNGNRSFGFKGVVGSRLTGAGWFGWSNKHLELLLKNNSENLSKCRVEVGKDGLRVLAERKVLEDGKIDSRVSGEYCFEGRIRGKAECKIEEKEYSTEIISKFKDFTLGGKIKIKEGASYLGGALAWFSKTSEAVFKYEAAGFDLGSASVFVRSEVRPDFVIGSKVATNLKSSGNEVKVGCLYELDKNHRFRAAIGHEGDVFFELRKRFNANLIASVSGGVNLNDLVSNKTHKEGVGLRFDYTNND